MRHYFKLPSVKWILASIATLIVVFLSHALLQAGQNAWSWQLVGKFIFLWHTEKFFLGSIVLLALDLLIIAIVGSVIYGNLIYFISITGLSIVTYLKMFYREEPIYPDDLKMILQVGMFHDILGNTMFIVVLVVSLVFSGFLVWWIIKSRLLPKNIQWLRLIVGCVSFALLFYATNFNQPNNILKKGYDRSALWIPYSQKMNYYNVGFVGGFLYNTTVEGMAEPEGYSKEAINKIVTKYNQVAQQANDVKETSEKPNVVYIMAESFSNPNLLKDVTVTPNPLVDYQKVATKSTISGQMLSQGYGGGTANIEFEALTGFSMALMSPQMTTPYTMLLPKQKSFPSVVSNLSQQGYQTTAIHPYNTSMYKRKDNYQLLGFETFKSEKTMKHTDKLTPESYISDESAFNEVLDQLKQQEEKPQFVHLVTMQTHMPYNTKYQQSDYQTNVEKNQTSIVNFAQDIAYTSQALASFMKELDELSRPTLVVFWGDHLPSIYPEEVVQVNTQEALHLTEFFVSNPFDQKKETNQVISPIYFQQFLSEKTGIEETGFVALLKKLHHHLPAFENQSYMYQNRWEKNVSLSPRAQEIFDEYQLIQYDSVSGQRYGKALFTSQSN
ncbi:hypothetical protein CBF34_01745 [Vagococcus penaei]|uniref:Uncharacterized protein n=1 Tax=Vagococcus penaei TaxID=633807 RepID=A0A1Q2D7M3_9ENTE|nr:LTA synthase family protein [Vagococcus penaei]AQP54357.1 hypothetical protein BW732_09055 [Vagococcus penaei]RSU06273.1 hypothetical protein CBF34_01745 [Vagococcus penaei]